MELKEFIKETLVEIIMAVKEAQENITNTGAEISPTGVQLKGGNEGPLTMYKRGKGIVQIVEFDIAITETEDKGSKAKIGVLTSVRNNLNQPKKNNQNLPRKGSRQTTAFRRPK